MNSNKINKLSNGDYVLSYNTELKKYEYKKVLRVLDNGEKELIKITLENSHILRCTKDHKLYTSKGYVEADKAVDVMTNNGYVNIISKENDIQENVYDIEVEDNHNFCVKNKNKDDFIIVHNCGAQTPFSSINYGTGTAGECRMIIKNVLKATEAGLGHHETPIFPIQIFKVKEGINALPGDPNYDLYQYACTISGKRFYPNFVNIDVPFNLQYYVPGKPETEMATMGCRTRVIGQLNTKEGSVRNRGNIAFTTINLPRLALESTDINSFFKRLKYLLCDCVDELLERVSFLCKKKVYNFPFLMGQNLYMGSEALEWNDNIEPALKNGTLSIGFTGLAECLVALTGKHHGESEESQKLGLRIISCIREKTDEATMKYGWNFSTFATPAESTAGKFLRSDRKKFGIVKGVTDREYYTNSFHIPVWFKIEAYKKMQLEGPYHELCNAGAITYIELDGDTSNSGKIIQKLVDYSRKCGISYFSINTIHDRCPICGYDGIINTNKCPSCGWIEGTEVEVKL